MRRTRRTRMREQGARMSVHHLFQVVDLATWKNKGSGTSNVGSEIHNSGEDKVHSTVIPVLSPSLFRRLKNRPLMSLPFDILLRSYIILGYTPFSIPFLSSYTSKEKSAQLCTGNINHTR